MAHLGSKIFHPECQIVLLECKSPRCHRTQNSELRTLLFDKNKYQASFKLYTRLLKLFRSIIIV